MILTCPSCGTRYVVKDGAIPSAGRTVRCAQCKHSWHQDAEEQDSSLEQDEPVQRFPEAGQDTSSTIDQESLRAGESASSDILDDDEQPLPGPEQSSQLTSSEGQSLSHSSAEVDEVEPDADTMPAEAAEAVDPYPQEVVPTESSEESVPVRSSHPLRMARADAEADDGYSPFASQDGEHDRPRRAWPLIAGLLLLAIAAIAAAVWFLAPNELKGRLGLAESDGSALLVQIKSRSSRPLESGNQLFEVSGLVINPTDEAQTVPPLQAQLRSLEQQVVYRWTIPPPSPRLAPGGSASFNSAMLDIPAAAACIEITLGTPTKPQPKCVEAEAAAGA